MQYENLKKKYYYYYLFKFAKHAQANIFNCLISQVFQKVKTKLTFFFNRIYFIFINIVA